MCSPARAEFRVDKTQYIENLSVLSTLNSALAGLHICTGSFFAFSGRLRKGHNGLVKVSKGAKIRNRYNQVPHLTQDTNGK